VPHYDDDTATDHDDGHDHDHDHNDKHHDHHRGPDDDDVRHEERAAPQHRIIPAPVRGESGLMTP
jgi:hypothetical protein